MNLPTRQLRVWERIFDTYRVATLSFLGISLKPTLRDLTGSNCLILTGVFIGGVLLRMCPSPPCKPQFGSSLWTSNDISGGHVSLLARATGKALQSPHPTLPQLELFGMPFACGPTHLSSPPTSCLVKYMSASCRNLSFLFFLLILESFCFNF